MRHSVGAGKSRAWYNDMSKSDSSAAQPSANLRRLRRAIATLLLLVLSAGLACSVGKKPAPVAVVRIAFVGTLSPEGKPLVTGTGARVAEEGWLEQELAKCGTSLRWVAMPGAAVGPMTNEAFANGGIDFAGYSELPSIIANSNGIHTKLIVPTGRGVDTFLVVPVDSQATSIHDLKGKKIAVHKGRPWELPFIRLLDSERLSYDDFNVMNLNPEVGVAALSAKKVDALVITTTAYLLEKKGLGRILWSTTDKSLEWKTVGGIWGSADFVEKHPDLTQLVSTAYVRAYHWASQDDNRAEVIRLFARNGTPEDIVAREYSEGGLSWKERWSPMFDEGLYEHYRSAIALAASKKIIPGPFDFRQSADDRFVLRAVQDLGIAGYWSASPPRIR